MSQSGEKIIQAVTFGLCIWFANETPTWRERSIKLYLVLITTDKNNYRLAVGGGGVHNSWNASSSIRL